MYESKYQKYITKSQARFSEANELRPYISIVNGSGNSAASGIPLYYENETLYVDNEDNHTIAQDR